MKIFVLLLSILFCAIAPAAEKTPAGLYVRDGVIMRAGQPYQGIGANYFSLLSRVLQNPKDDSSLKNLELLHKAGIPFVRFMAGGFWPVEMALYKDDKDEFFRRFDRVVRAAEKANVGLIPSLFWHTSTVADLCGEPLDQYGNEKSKSIAFIRQYTTDVVTRYKGSPAIWAWEFGNEYNLGADLPNAAEHRPATWPQLGTPAMRSERDELKWPHIETALRVFAETVRKIDATRLIENGNSVPRQSAWHNFHERSWTDDTPEQFGEIMRRDNPAPLDAICVHIYPEAKNHYAAGATSLDGIIGVAAQQAKAIGKPLFIGEFGVSLQEGDKDTQQKIFDEFLRAIQKHKVPLAAFWVFDLPSQDKDWNVTFENERAWMIERVGRFNRENNFQSTN